MTFVKGDRFIYYGKPQTVLGIVEKVNKKFAFDLIHGVKIVKLEIVSEKGEKFDSNLCRKIERDLLPKFVRRLKNL